MKVELMRKIDFFVGNTIVFIFGIIKKILGTIEKVKGERYIEIQAENFYFKGDINKKFLNILTNTPKKFVIAKFFGLGSIILSSPVIQEIKMENENNKTIFLTFKQNEKLLKIMKCVDEIITIRTDNIINFIKDVFSAIIKLRREKVDVFYDFEFFSKFSAFLSFLSGAKIKIGFWSISTKRGNINDIKIKYNQNIHIVENFLLFSRSIGIKEKENWIKLLQNSLKEEEIEKIKQKNDKENKKNDNKENKKRKLVTINPIPSEIMSNLRKWEKEKWEKLAKTLSQNFSVLILGTEDKEYNIEGENIENLVGKTNFEDFLYKIMTSDIVVTLDSFPLHLAVALKKKVIALFGPESPIHYGYNIPDVKIITKNLPCSPCINIHKAKLSDILCKNNICMKKIDIKDVLKKVEEI